MGILSVGKLMLNLRYIRIPLLILCMGLFNKIAYADLPGIPEDQAIRAILGEAEGESYAGKVALAYALKNRGKLNGVYGHKAVILRSGAFWRGQRPISRKATEEARNAWQKANSFPKLDPTKGASFWENTQAFGTPYWARSMTKTLTLGNHSFYLEAK